MTHIGKKTGEPTKSKLSARELAQEMRRMGNTVKVVVLVEKDPLSDKFIQILFTKEQMMRVMDAIEKEFPKHGEVIDVETDEREYHLPDIQDHI